MKTVLVVLAIALSGCATTAPQGTTPAQTVFAAKSAYEVALNAAVSYKKLPPCASGVLLCKEPSVVKQMQDADNRAWPILDKAEAGARNNSITQIAADEAANVVDEFKRLACSKVKCEEKK